MLLFIPLLLLQVALLGLGFGMLISALTSKYRDLTFVMSFGVQLWMFASPIVYPLSVVPEKYKLYILANPMTPIIEGFRHAFIGKGVLETNMFLYSIFFTLVTFILGLLVFNKMEKNFIDTV